MTDFTTKGNLNFNAKRVLSGRITLSLYQCVRLTSAEAQFNVRLCFKVPECEGLEVLAFELSVEVVRIIGCLNNIE